MLLFAVFSFTLFSTGLPAFVPWFNSYGRTRIIGGSEVDIVEVPYQVSLQKVISPEYSSHECGGVIITNSLILTAGHCVAVNLIPRNWRVRVGSASISTSGSVHNVSKISLHPRFTTNYDYDVALMALVSPIVLDASAAVIGMAGDSTVLSDDDLAFVSGWGALTPNGIYPDLLQRINVTIVNQDVCRQSYSWLAPVTDRMLCAGTSYEDESDIRDACSGDSGGPLTVDGVLVGLVSWGYSCARPSYPGVYTRISALRSWIDDEAVLLSNFLNS